MQVLIETYRKFEIFFNTEKEMFYTVSDSWDTESQKKSYAGIKKWIDDFIKDNSDFKPFFMIGDGYKKGKNIRIIGTRKDGRFIYEDEKGVKHQLSEHDEKNYIIPQQENEPIYEILTDLEKQRIEILAKIKENEGKLVRVTAKDVKQNYKI